ncbi:hypothetical protein OK016_17915 [Vibrio chagasii]|nr:hypothetical protein [Vibrio chagasii]
MNVVTANARVILKRMYWARNPSVTNSERKDMTKVASRMFYHRGDNVQSRSSR